ncbi:PREDICTED: ABC transporter G family member 38 [Tarenaya hassleriana]|uniref:ABC transporter G family member 38 n=1 Tax=Tarenaya hassleriana TaxID=28532 RepID=UPI00053C65CB|nr:PREDICTED: ABC transporter G family member 38 [Tarenaya hassleriana]
MMLGKQPRPTIQVADLSRKKMGSHYRVTSETSSLMSGRGREEEEEEEEAMQWAALERLQRLSTYDRVRKVVLRGVTGDFKEFDMKNLGFEERRELFDRVITNNDENWHEEYLRRLKKRIDRVSLDLPTIEVRYKDVNVTAEAYVGNRALPTIMNSFVNIVEDFGARVGLLSDRKKKFSVLTDISGIIKPGRLTLLLGPPGSGKSTFLQVLSGKLDAGLKISGDVTYNGHEFHEFVPQRTAAYISQYDVHLPQLTVRETLTFSAKCQGVGTGYDMLVELLRREKNLNIKPDPYLDALMKVSVMKGHKEDVVTDYVLKILGLDICADTIVGNNMIRGISGGQKKRVTTGEMLVGPVGAFFMDNISDGLDSSTTFQIIKCIRQMIHVLNKTALVSLLQPPPETFDLFDDVILLAEGRIVYQGPRENVLEFFESMGFKCPARKGTADYLQEVISIKDQEQYWANHELPYRYVSVKEFSEAFKSFHVSKTIKEQLEIPFDRSKNHRAALTKTKYGASKFELLKNCLEREYLLMKRTMFVYGFKSFQLELNGIIIAIVFSQSKNYRSTVEDGYIYMGSMFLIVQMVVFSGFFELPMTIEKLPVFYKQRDFLFFPSWAFSLPTSIIGFPISFIEVIILVALTYYVIGFNPSAAMLFKHYFVLSLCGQMSYGLFRCIAAISRDHVVSNTLGCLALMWLITFNGFVLSRKNVHKWLVWGYWTSPLMYVQTAISVNEFLSDSWRKVLDGAKESLGKTILKSRGTFSESYWYWIGILALIVSILLSNAITALSLAYLNEYGKSRVAAEREESVEEKRKTDQDRTRDGTRTERQLGSVVSMTSYDDQGMLLPFKPLCLTFENIKYSVDMPKAMKSHGFGEERLELLKGVTGAFRPGVLTALMGVSGAGKTTLMDVLAGRKNSGYIEGDIKVSGFPKKQESFARVVGYCEQSDIHSPLVTVYESLVYSAWLRLPRDIDARSRELFIEEVMELIELKSLRDMLVGYPTVSGLSTEQRKRLTVAVELVANPSIIFMDEPTSGLDARAAAIVMRTVRNTVDTGRTVVCTIHQPSIDIFESFDELILMTRGGEEIYVGPLGQHSCQLIEFFQSVKGVERIKDGINPATWALEVTTRAQEDVLGVKFAEVYKNSDLYRRNKEMIAEINQIGPEAQDIHFETMYSQSYFTQFKACFWRQHRSYWRNVPYNASRLWFSAAVGIMYGIIFFGLGKRRGSRQDIFNNVGAMTTCINFLGAQSAATARPVVIAGRAVFYRERAAGMYSALPYALAQVAIEIPYTMVQACIYTVIVYAMIGYEWTAAKFLLTLFFMFITILYFIFNGIAIISVSPSQEFGAVLNGIISVLWTVFSGFAIPSPRIPSWIRWYTKVCPVSWSTYGVVSSQYGDTRTRLETGETVAQFMSDYYGFNYDFLWAVSIILIAFAVFFASIYAFSVKVLNFQKR